MIRGFTWHNLILIALFLALLVLSISGDGYLRLNYQLLTQGWETLKIGGQNLWTAQGRAAKDLDAKTIARYGKNPWDDRGENCVTAINSKGGATIGDLQVVSRGKSKTDVTDLIGQPFCITVAGSDIWLVGDRQYIEVSYKPQVNVQLKTYVANKRENQ